MNHYNSNPLLCCHAATGDAPCAACLTKAAAALIAHSDAIDQAAEFAAAVWRDRAAAELERARTEGYLEAIAEVKSTQHGIAVALSEVGDVTRARWHLCCRACRRARHRPGCRDCEDRTRETFGAPMAGEYAGGPIARERAA